MWRNFLVDEQSFGGPSLISTVGSKSIADLEKCLQVFISEKVLMPLRDRPSLELMIVSSNNFQVLLLLQNKLLESV